MKPFTSLLTAALLSAASLSACGGSENRMSIQEQTEKRFQLNPHPTKAYRIKIKINDAPGPLKLTGDIYIRYMARNCSYVINELEGASAEPTKYVNYKARPIGHDEYEVIFYSDAVQDEDYFGKGVCHWKPDGFGGAFNATGKPEETRFSISDVMEDLIEQKTLTKYYWKGAYPYLKDENGSKYDDDVVSYGSDSPTKYSTDKQKDLFNITITLEEMKS
ncbi:MAG: hypothetical protein Q4A84_09070 [Neisseria sp.]|uniref:hypothetical protein n=1 Tax=Neisseria sp. TaxID=192066 RepID=UPI0026DCF7CA|nr:hypothetical protein [Neisseria sp.]MDO4641828.1 hypothetical protein [Neisseria sp.]